MAYPWGHIPGNLAMDHQAIVIISAAAKLLQSCPTPCDPMDCSPPGSSVRGILQARTLEWIACPPPGDPNLGIKPAASLMSPAKAGGLFTSSATWEVRRGVGSSRITSSHLYTLSGSFSSKVSMQGQSHTLSIPHLTHCTHLPPGTHLFIHSFIIHSLILHFMESLWSPHLPKSLPQILDSTSNELLNIPP